MSDAFEQHDAAYVIGALDPGEEAAFEAHLARCGDCRARVAELRALLPVLAVAPRDTVEEAPPDTLLPALLRKAARGRRRRRGWLIASAAAVAAVLLGAALALLPSSGDAPVHERAMTALTDAPLTASAAVIQKPHGTDIRVHCRYTANPDHPYRYTLTVIGKQGAVDEPGKWSVTPGKDFVETYWTAFNRDQIRLVQITDYEGRPILQLEP